jgi:hypothetical protein
MANITPLPAATRLTKSSAQCIISILLKMASRTISGTSTGRPLGTERFIKRLEKVLGRDLFPKKAG